MSSNQSNGPNPVEGYTQGTGTSSSDPFITIFQTRDPTPYDFQYPVKKRWINLSETSEWILTGFSNVTGQSLAIWILLNAGNDLITLSDQGNHAVTPDSNGDIQLTGAVFNQTGTFPTTVSNLPGHRIGINPMSPARWIVDQLSLGQNGTSTTIGAAIASASPGDTIFVLPGNYVENLLSIPAGLNITGFTGDGFTGNVTITGHHTYTADGTLSFDNIQFNSDASNTFTVSGGNSSIIDFNNCEFNVNNNITAAVLSSGPVSSGYNFTNCTFNVKSATGRFIAVIGGGLATFLLCKSNNPILSTTANVCSSGFINAVYSDFTQAFSFSGSGSGTWEHSLIGNTANNTTCLALTSNSFLSFKWCRFDSGTAVAVTIGPLSAPEMMNCNFFGAPAGGNIITGTGALLYSNLAYNGTAADISVTTQLPIPTGPIIQLSPFSGTLPVNSLCGSGSPNGVVTAPIGSIFSRTDPAGATSRIYVNTNGGTTWTNITCAA